MWDGFNKRKFPRVNLECEITIQSTDQAPPLRAITQNVGAGGVAVLLDKSLERFSSCRVRLQLSPKKTVEGEGKVVWIVPTKEPKSSRKRYDTGIEFMGFSEDDQALIIQFLTDHLAKEGS
jgi:hypothetical protein